MHILAAAGKKPGTQNRGGRNDAPVLLSLEHADP
jgi:hypothetical protein